MQGPSPDLNGDIDKVNYMLLLHQYNLVEFSACLSATSINSGIDGGMQVSTAELLHYFLFDRFTCKL